MSRFVARFSGSTGDAKADTLLFVFDFGYDRPLSHYFWNLTAANGHSVVSSTGGGQELASWLMALGLVKEPTILDMYHRAMLDTPITSEPNATGKFYIRRDDCVEFACADQPTFTHRMLLLQRREAFRLGGLDAMGMHRPLACEFRDWLLENALDEFSSFNTIRFGMDGMLPLWVTFVNERKPDTTTGYIANQDAIAEITCRMASVCGYGAEYALVPDVWWVGNTEEVYDPQAFELVSPHLASPAAFVSKPDHALLEKIQTEVSDKNLEWHHMRVQP